MSTWMETIWEISPVRNRDQSSSLVIFSAPSSTYLYLFVLSINAIILKDSIVLGWVQSKWCLAKLNGKIYFLTKKITSNDEWFSPGLYWEKKSDKFVPEFQQHFVRNGSKYLKTAKIFNLKLGGMLSRIFSSDKQLLKLMTSLSLSIFDLLL